MFSRYSPTAGYHFLVLNNLYHNRDLMGHIVGSIYYNILLPRFQHCPLLSTYTNVLTEVS